MNPTDITFRPEKTGKQALSVKLEYVTNTAQRLFHMIPGTDIYDNEMGLDIIKESKRPANNGTRNTEYESRIIDQFNAYTDLSVRSVMALYEDNTLKVYMSVTYQDQTYKMVADSQSDELNILSTGR